MLANQVYPNPSRRFAHIVQESATPFWRLAHFDSAESGIPIIRMLARQAAL
ncbi:hypothetical protein [Cupriavidus necator]